MIDWDTCRGDFRWDGGLRDICITGIKLADWSALYPLLRDAPGAEYWVDGVLQPLPASVEQMFAVRPVGNPMLRFRIGAALVAVHFFSENEFECDIDPREITSQTDLDALLGFIRDVGDVMNKPVILCPENMHDWPFITYDPQSREFRYHAADD